MLKPSSFEYPPYSPHPLPIPVPPRESIEPFTIVIQPHGLFPPGPIPADFEPPATTREPSSTVWIVIFESNEHSIPPFTAAVDTIEFVPAPTIVAELPQTVTAAVVFTLIS
jgi:hypothetical protein